MVQKKLRPTNPLFLEEEELQQGIELLFFANRDLTKVSNEYLDKDGIGRAHHRVLHFVSRHNGISVAKLLRILRITKQSLSRVLTQLIDEEFIEQKKSQNDGRQRHLYITEKGSKLEKKISNPQLKRIARAYKNAGSEAVENYRKVLIEMVDEEEHDEIINFLENKR
tara:strand:- start:581 stop:1081 length:501 start_codon:yes stop_codon:yes gene_type:complete